MSKRKSLRAHELRTGDALRPSDVDTLDEPARYDVITAFDAIHDQARPRDVPRHVAWGPDARASEKTLQSFFKTIPPEEATGTLGQLYDEDLRKHGRVLGATRMLSLRPEVSAAWRSLNGALQSTMDPRHYELATLAASITVRCSS